MKHIVLFLIAFIAVVTFIRAFDRTDADASHEFTRHSAVEVYSTINGNK